MKDSQDELVIEFLPSVRLIASKLSRRLPPSVELPDLISAGAEALVRCSRRFIKNRNESFWGYSKYRVYGAMLDYLRHLDTHGRKQRLMAKLVDSAALRYFEENDEEPSDEVLSSMLSVSLQDIRKARLVGYETTDELDDDQRDISNQDTYDLVEKQELISLVLKCVQKLSSRERLVITQYYLEENKLEDVAKTIGISITRVFQIQKNALMKIRKTIEDPKNKIHNKSRPIKT